MPVDVNAVMNIVKEVAEEENMKVCIKNSLAGGAVTGAFAAGSGMLLGPIGLAIGGTVGGLISYVAFNGTYKSIPEIINEMDASQKKALANKVYDVLNKLDMTDLIAFGSLAAGGTSVRDMVIKEIIAHFQDSLKMDIIC